MNPPVLPLPDATPEQFMTLTREMLMRYYRHQIREYEEKLSNVDDVNWDSLFETLKEDYMLTGNRPMENYLFIVPEVIQRIEETLED